MSSRCHAASGNFEDRDSGGQSELNIGNRTDVRRQRVAIVSLTPRRKVTIRDVAEYVGLSTMTVSRALNGERDVSAESVRRVLAAVEQLDYRRNPFARGLSRSRSFLICQIMSEHWASYVAEFQQAAVRACRGRDYHLVALPLGGSGKSRPDDLADAAATLRPDGFLVLPPTSDDVAVLEVLAKLEKPYVRIAPSIDLGRASAVSIDDVEAARRMTEALLDLGHSRIGFLGGPHDHAASAWRFEGFRLALSERGLVVDPRLIRHGVGIFEMGGPAATSLLGGSARPTAVFAFNDEAALALMAAASHLGLRVPEDLSVTGFDDSEIAQVAWPPLTTVRQPIQEMASVATNLLIDQIESDGKTPTQQTLAFSLVMRGTTAAPPDAIKRGRAAPTNRGR